MAAEYRIVSIGTLSRNRLWGEGAPVRTGHATTTLISDGDRLILVDPSLPATALAAHFGERTGRSLSDVTDVFCTTLRPVHRRSVAVMGQAKWWCSAEELEAYRDDLQTIQETADRLGADEAATVEAELKLLNRFQPAPERFTPQVQLYPLFGPSPGCAGLLLTPPTTTVVIAGDAAITADHVRQGLIWKGCFDVEQAMRSLEDLLEIADVIVPGHDNVIFSPQRNWL